MAKKKTTKDFKPHMMYSKTGKAVRAKTFKEHLNLKEKSNG